MLLTEKVFNKFKSKVNSNRIVITEEMLNEGIKLNQEVEKTLKDGLDKVIEGKKHIQLLTHVDLDGICSAIAIVQYLKKKGYSNDNITVTFGQYGDKKLKIKETPTKNKAVIVSDFGKLSTVKIFDEFQIMSNFGFTNQKYKLVEYLNKTDFTKYSVEDLVKDMKTIFRIVPKSEEAFKKSAKKLLAPLKIYSEIKTRTQNPIDKITVGNIESYRLQNSNPDYVVDHHNNDDKNLRGGENGLLDIETPSNAAALGKILGVFSAADCDAINMIDGAQYDKNELKRATFLDDKYPAKTPERALAIKITAYIEQATKKDNRTAEAIVKHSGPSLESLADTLEKSLKLNAAKVKILDALTKGVPVPVEGGKTKKIFDSKEIYKYVKNIVTNEIPAEFASELDGHNSKKKTIEGIDKKIFNPESSFYKNREGRKIGEMADFDAVKQKTQRTTKETITGRATRKEVEEFKQIIQSNKGDLTDKEVNELIGGIKSDDKTKVSKANKLLLKIRENLTDDEKKKVDVYISKIGRINSWGHFAMQKSDEMSDITKHYPSRYTVSLYSKNGSRFPFVIKRFSDFIQAAKNPLYEGNVDFGKVIPAVKEVVKNYMDDLLEKKEVSKWVHDHVIDSMNYDSGGHKAILNFQGFSELKAPSKDRGNKDAATAMLDRIKKANKLKNSRLGTKAENYFPKNTAKYHAILNNSEANIAKYDKYKKELIDKVMETIMRKTMELYPPKPEDLLKLRTSENDNEVEDKS